MGGVLPGNDSQTFVDQYSQVTETQGVLPGLTVDQSQLFKPFPGF